MNKLIPSFALLSVIGLSACSQESTQTSSKEAPIISETQDAATLPEGFFLAEAPANAVSLSEARANAKTGDEIVFTGYIGGRATPFTESRALFILADSEKAPACEDGCETPWDACCVANEDIVANSATIQVVDENNKTLHLDMNGQNGLKPGSLVTVTGNVREANDAVLIVDATGVAINN